MAMEASNDPEEFQNNSIKQNLEITIPLKQDSNTRPFHLGLLLISCLSLVRDKQYHLPDWFTYMKDECYNVRAEYFRVQVGRS